MHASLKQCVRDKFWSRFVGSEDSLARIYLKLVKIAWVIRGRVRENVCGTSPVTRGFWYISGVDALSQSI